MIKIMLTYFMFFLSTSLYAQENLVFGQPTLGYPHNAATDILRKAYGKLGLNFSFTNLPGKRSLVHSNTGLIDGELLRVQGINIKYPNLIVVPVSIAQLEQVVFTKNASFDVKGWESLRPYKIGIRLGVEITKKKTEGMIQEFTRSDDSNFKKLAAGRIDVIARGRVAGLAIIKKLKLKGLNVLEPPLEIIKLFHVLNKKRINLAFDELRRR